MKIFNAIKTGIIRSLKAWNGVFILWFFSLMMVSLIAIPVKGALNAGFGKSMITEKLMNGLDIEVFGDLGASLHSVISFFSSGLLLMILLGILINSFFTGGLFDRLRVNSGRFSAVEFFGASAKNLWSFLVISLVLSLIILILALLVIVLPLSVISQAEIPKEGALFKAAIFTFSIFMVLLTTILLVSDYARAYQVLKDKNVCFKAIGFGFSQTFRNFFSSFTLMIGLLLVQILFIWIGFKIVAGMKPVTGGGVFLLFIISQFLFFIRLMLKTLRFGSVTSLMEQNLYNKTVIAQPDV
jgi:hypothetical protein